MRIEANLSEALLVPTQFKNFLIELRPLSERLASYRQLPNWNEDQYIKGWQEGVINIWGRVKEKLRSTPAEE